MSTNETTDSRFPHNGREIFCQDYGGEPEGEAFCPYRVCPIGAHVDHNHGRVTGLAIDRGIRVLYRAEESGRITLRSMQFPVPVSFSLTQIPQRQKDWADYLRGATLALSERVPLSCGISCVIEGSLPIGGLSSSAAVIISYLSALCRVNHVRLTEEEMIGTALEAENRYVGVSCGTLDQSCEVYCRKEHLLYLDTLDGSYELIPRDRGMKPFKIAVFFSGIERTLDGSGFNMRVDELRSAAYALKAYAGIGYGRFDETFLRDVPYEAFLAYRDRLPEPFRRRAEHWYSENERVIAGAEAWRRGDIEAYGRLSFESGMSSIDNWETGSPELKTLYEIMRHTDGIYGGRFSGAGFKGCCMALIDPSYETSIRETVRRDYLKHFPLLSDKYCDAICDSADGVAL